MKFVCTVETHYDDPAFQDLHILALSDEDEEGDDEEDGLPYETVLGSAKILRYFDPEFTPEDFPDYVWQFMDGESADLEVVAELFSRYGDRVNYVDEMQEIEFCESSAGFLVIDRFEVAPFARGHGIGTEILREIRRQHAGLLMYCALTAEPYQMDRGAERDAIKKRLISWYKSQDDMHLYALAPRKHPQFLVGVWDGRNLDYEFFEIEDRLALARSWKASQEKAEAA